MNYEKLIEEACTLRVSVSNIARHYTARMYAYGYISHTAAVESDKNTARANRILGKIDKRIIRRILAKQAITS